jgi:hypothetical protein
MNDASSGRDNRTNGVLARLVQKEAPMRLAFLGLLLLPSLAFADGDLYRQRLDELDRRVARLKSDILQQKARLKLIQYQYIPGHAIGTRARIVHRNEMGSIYTPIQMAYALDGEPILTRSADHDLFADRPEIEVFQGPLSPGSHTLSVRLVYRGNGAFFRYVDGYRFTVQASHDFTPADGKETVLTVVGRERGNPITTDMQDRPTLDFHTSVGPAAEPR